MKLDEKSLRIGAIALLGAVALRLALPALSNTQDLLGSTLLFFETGRWITPAQQSLPASATDSTNMPQEEIALPVFSPEEAKQISLKNSVGYSVDAQKLLVQPLKWNLKTEEPSVLIVHSHATESYKNTENYKALPNYRTLDDKYNMLSIGDALAHALEEKGIHVVHDRATHDYPSYNNAYGNSRKSISEYLQEYPSISLVLDLHRDSYEDSKGNQIGYTVNYGDSKAAKLMLVVGTFDRNSQSPQWHENMSLAAKLQVQLQRQCPGIVRPINIRSYHFNQDLSPKTLLVEVGAAGNTRQEALNAVQALAQSIIALAMGSESGNMA